MKIFVKFDFQKLGAKVLQNQLQQCELEFSIPNFGEVEIYNSVDDKKKNQIIEALEEYGIEIVENQKTILVEKIKETIRAMIASNDKEHQVKSSIYLAETLGHSYGYLSNLFSEVTYTSIEHFTILQKIEQAKALLIKENLSLTEIAYQLHYSSVAHLSSQFKKTTGLTPSAFQRIIKKRKQLLTS